MSFTHFRKEWRFDTRCSVACSRVLTERSQHKRHHLAWLLYSFMRCAGDAHAGGKCLSSLQGQGSGNWLWQAGPFGGRQTLQLGGWWSCNIDYTTKPLCFTLWIYHLVNLNFWHILIFFFKKKRVNRKWKHASLHILNSNIKILSDSEI